MQVPIPPKLTYPHPAVASQAVWEACAAAVVHASQWQPSAAAQLDCSVAWAHALDFVISSTVAFSTQMSLEPNSLPAAPGAKNTHAGLALQSVVVL
jgi:hypothetical protein